MVSELALGGHLACKLVCRLASPFQPPHEVEEEEELTTVSQSDRPGKINNPSTVIQSTNNRLRESSLRLALNRFGYLPSGLVTLLRHQVWSTQPGFLKCNEPGWSGAAFGNLRRELAISAKVHVVVCVFARASRTNDSMNV